MIILIAAVDSAGGIAKDGNIPWKCPEDMKHFAETTKGFVGAGRKNAVVMGKTTFLTLRKPLVDRVNFVVSRTLEFPATPELKCFRDLSSAIHSAVLTCRDVYIIGGESIYSHSLESGSVDRCIITKLYKSYNCDQFLDLDKYDFKVTNRRQCGYLEIISYDR